MHWSLTTSGQLCMHLHTSTAVPSINMMSPQYFYYLKNTKEIQWIPFNRDRLLQPKKSRLTENPLYPKLFMYCYLVNGFSIFMQLTENPLYPNPD